MVNNLGISKHIFLFPFKWELYKSQESSLLEKINIKTFVKKLGNNWVPYQFSIEKNVKANLNTYNEYAYFYDHIREVLNLNKNEDSCQFSYNITKNAKYIIDILGEEKPFELDIEEIFLNIYSSGIAVLGFELINKEEKDFDKILKINEYGRRIYPQFLGASELDENEQEILLTNDTKKCFLANRITLTGVNVKDISESFEHYEKYAKIELKPFVLPAHIQNILDTNFITKFEEKFEDAVIITPIIDDRMFVMSFLFNDTLMMKLNKFKDKNEYEYVDSKEWFRYVFIDDSKPSCTSKTMLKTLLQESTYDRWIEKSEEEATVGGHLFGITRYSFVILGVREWVTENLIYKHFSNQYFQIILLSLVQRASIISYGGEVTRIVNKIKTDRILSNKEIDDINALNQSFLVFKNQIYFREVTAQDQGIEIYNKVQQQMNILAEVEALEDEIKDLVDFVNANSEVKRSKEAHKLTKAATWFLPAGVIVGLMGINAFSKENMVWGGSPDIGILGWLLLVIVLCVVAAIGFDIYLKKKNK
jgi:hypothetical protein